MAELLLKLRDREISRTPIKHMRIVIGRDATCDVVIDNAGVSRNHAVVLFDEGEFRIRDTESQNGITVNGKRVNDAALNYGDVIGLGKFELELIETADEVELRAGTAAESICIVDITLRGFSAFAAVPALSSTSSAVSISSSSNLPRPITSP